jgi:hypothetical protein
MNDIDHEKLREDLLKIVEKYDLSQQGFMYAVMGMYNTTPNIKKIDFINWLFNN